MAEDIDRVWDLMESISICMLTTWDGEWTHARPMAAHVRRRDNAIHFLTDVRWHKDDEIARYPKVCLAFAESRAQKYVSLTGVAEVSNDRARIHELWSMPAKAWWDSAEDPNIRVLTVSPHDAEYWDSPGTLASYLKMAAAAVSDARPDLGENRKVAM